MFWKKAAPGAEPPRRLGQTLSDSNVKLRSLSPDEVRRIVNEFPPRLPDELLADWLKRIDASQLEWAVCMHLQMLKIDPSTLMSK